MNGQSGGFDGYSVEGTTYSPLGAISTEKGQLLSASELQTEPMTKLAEISAVCNDARVVYSEDKHVYSNIGEPTEAALKVLVEKIGCPDMGVMKELSNLSLSARSSAVNSHYESSITRLLTFEFSRDRKLMSVLVQRQSDAGTDKGALFVKGAPESVLERCTSIRVGGSSVPLTDALKSDLLQRTRAYGLAGLRTLALAYTDVSSTSSPMFHDCQTTSQYAAFEQGLTFAGLVGMLDPPRPEVRGAVANCQAAGIRVIVITGDNKGTAETVCRRIGVFGELEDLTGKSITGRELDEMTQEQKVACVQKASLFTRTEPSHKSQLVDLLQGLGLVVAMVSSPFILCGEPSFLITLACCFG